MMDSTWKSRRIKCLYAVKKTNQDTAEGSSTDALMNRLKISDGGAGGSQLDATRKTPQSEAGQIREVN